MNTTNHYEIVRFRLVLGLALLMFILLTFSSINNYVSSNQNPLPTLGGAFIGLLGFIIVVITKKYRILGMIICILNLLLISATFLILNSLNYATPMWMVLNIVFTFFILKRIWGISILVIHSFIFIYYLLNIHAENLKNFDIDFNTVAWNFAIEFLIILLFFGYMFTLYLSAAKKSEDFYLSSNQLLNEQYSIISKKNKEAEILLKEIHHRVKNNLQIISSLLRLQAGSKNRGREDDFLEAINRVNAMAIIHERMYKSDMLSDFDLQEYLSGLIESLISNYDIEKKIKIEYQITVKQISSKSLVPIALLLNELITNSLKHAFEKKESEPTISVLVAPLGLNDFIIEYSDNGVWKEQSSESLGMEIVEAMTNQLEGSKTRVTNENGTFYVFMLKNQL